MMRVVTMLLMCSVVAPAARLTASQGMPVDRSADYWYAYAERLPIGSAVDVRTTDGKRMSAMLAIVDRDGITIEPKTRIPEAARRIRYDEIQQLTLKKNGTGTAAKAIAIGAGVGAGTFLGLLAILASSWD